MGIGRFIRTITNIGRDVADIPGSLVDAVTPGPSNPSDDNPKTFGFYADIDDPDTLSLLQSKREEVLVMDLCHDHADTNFNRSEIATLKEPAVRRKCVLATLSVGLAEESRAYWGLTVIKQETANPGSLILGPAPTHGHDYVKFWTQPWKAIVFDYIDQILDAGFTGVYLRNVDVYTDIKKEFPPDPSLRVDMAIAMKNLLRQIVNYIRNRAPNADIFLEGGNDYFGDDEFIGKFDALVQRGIWYQNGVKRETKDYWPTLRYMLQARRKLGVWLFDIEEVVSPPQATNARANFIYRGLGGFLVENDTPDEPVVPVANTPTPAANVVETPISTTVAVTPLSPSSITITGNLVPTTSIIADAPNVQITPTSNT